jgi:hypothetical protein
MVKRYVFRIKWYVFLLCYGLAEWPATAQLFFSYANVYISYVNECDAFQLLVTP